MKKTLFGVVGVLVLSGITVFAAQLDEKPSATGQSVSEEETQRLNDPAFKYPYSAQSAGIELCPGLCSGASLEWFFKDVKSRKCTFEVRGGSSKEWWVSLLRSDMAGRIFVFATESRPDGEMLAALGKKEIRGGLVKVNTVVVGEKIGDVIAEYKKSFPGLKHTRSAKSKTQQSRQSGIVVKVKHITVTDRLSSDKLEILINSRRVAVSVSGNQPKETLNQIADVLKMDLMRDINREGFQVTITDKVLEKYFSTLRSAPAVK